MILPHERETHDGWSRKVVAQPAQIKHELSRGDIEFIVS